MSSSIPHRLSPVLCTRTRIVIRPCVVRIRSTRYSSNLENQSSCFLFSLLYTPCVLFYFVLFSSVPAARARGVGDGGGKGGLPKFLSFCFPPPVQQTIKSVIGHRVKLFLGLATNTLIVKSNNNYCPYTGGGLSAMNSIGMQLLWSYKLETGTMA